MELYAIINTSHGPCGPAGVSRGECFVAGEDGTTYGDLEKVQEAAADLEEEFGHEFFRIFQLVPVEQLEELQAALQAALDCLCDPYLGEDDGERQRPTIDRLRAVIAKTEPTGG